MYSEKTSLITPPSFYVRRGDKTDVPGVMAIDQHLMMHSLRSSLEIPPSAENTAFRFPDPGHKMRLGMVATSPEDELVKGDPSTASTHFVDGVSRHQTIATTKPFKGLLGSGQIHSFRELSEQRRTFDRSAYILIDTLEPDMLGFQLWKAVNAALIDEAVARCRATLRYKVLVSIMMFRKDQPHLVAFRDVFLEAGFKQVGMIEELSEKDGVLLDRAILQLKLY